MLRMALLITQVEDGFIMFLCGKEKYSEGAQTTVGDIPIIQVQNALAD